MTSTTELERSAPGLHWGFVVLLSSLTGGAFQYIWAIVQAAYIKKLDPESKALVSVVTSVLLIAVVTFVPLRLGDPTVSFAIGFTLFLAGVALLIAGTFQMRESLQEYLIRRGYRNENLSVWMTLFFNVLYLQYHLSALKAGGGKMEGTLTLMGGGDREIH